MRTINEKFTDEEYDKLKKAKGERSWHDFIYTLVKSDNTFDIDAETKIW